MILARDIHEPDAFGRLTTVKTRGGSPVTVSEYRYNGLGHRIGWRSDTNFDSTVDGSDPWYWFTYDDRWRVVATYRGSDAHPKERFIHHNAGLGGLGGSSYIDSVILRDSDDPEAWTNAADGTLETRHYYLQNWRHDVVALIEPDGTPFEYIRYSAYGVPTVYAAGDVNRDGVCDGYDPQDWDDYNDYGAGALAVDLDVNRDGVIDSADRALVQGHADWLLWTSHGRGSVSRLHNRRGYAGYEFDPATAQWHVRNRVLVSEMGRWNRRDPLGYVDGMSVYEYVGSRAVLAVDPTGRSPDDDFSSVEIAATHLSGGPSAACQARYNRARNHPSVVAAYAAARAACRHGVPPPTFVLKECDGNTRGYFNCDLTGGSTVIICTNPNNVNCQDESSMQATMIHEITHYAQFCRWSTAPGGNNDKATKPSQLGYRGSCLRWKLIGWHPRTFLEVEAYCKEIPGRCSTPLKSIAEALCEDVKNSGGSYCACMSYMGFPCPPHPLRLYARWGSGSFLSSH